VAIQGADIVRPATGTIDIQPRHSGGDGAPDCWRPQRWSLGVPPLHNTEGFFPRRLLGGRFRFMGGLISRPFLHELGGAEAAVAIGLFYRSGSLG
jgi:hypothetical protein